MYNSFVKKILILFLILSLFAFYAPKNAEASEDFPFLSGAIVSNISLQSFVSKYANLPIGLVKDSNVIDLIGDEELANLHSVPLFAQINLFTYTMTGSRQMNEADLINYYNTISPTDVQGRETLRAALMSLYRENGKIVEYTLPSEPEVKITYRTESTKSGLIQIPERHIEKTNNITTYFLLDPFKVIDGERLSAFDIAKTYDIDPCFFNTLVQRNKLNNSNLDFSGFYVDLPSNSVTDSYQKILSKSLEKLSKTIHSLGKLLIVEGLTKETLPLGQYGDIIGITYSSDNLDLLKEARLSYPNKQIFAMFNGVLNSQGDIETLLNYCTFYGIYPEFGRDSQTGDFFYYEDLLNTSTNLLTSRLALIKQLNEAGFKNSITSGNATISVFGNSNFSFYCIKGNSTVTFNLNDNTDFLINHPFKALNESGKSLNVINKSNVFEATDTVNGFDFVRVAPEAFSLMNLGVFKEPSHKTGFETNFINTGLASGKANITLKTPASTFPVELTLNQFEEKTIILDQLPETVSFENISFTAVQPKGELNYNYLFILLILLAMLGVALTKNIRIKKKISSNVFSALAIVISIAVICLNRVYIHYSATSITYISFAVLFLIYSFRGDNPKRALLAALFILFVGSLYNVMEFGTLLPSFFNGIPPIQSFEQVLFFFPFIFVLFFFFTSQNKNITKAELLVILLAISSLIFFFDSLSVPFFGLVTVRSLMPFIVILGGVTLLELFYKKLNLKVVLLIISGFIVIFVSIPLSNLNYAQAPGAYRILLSLRDFYLLLAPLLFLAVEGHNSKKVSPGTSLNLMTFVIILLILAYFMIACATYLRLGSPYFTKFGYIAIPVLLSLFIILFIEPIYTENYL
jgi:hypothetical protein